MMSGQSKRINESSPQRQKIVSKYNEKIIIIISAITLSKNGVQRGSQTAEKKMKSLITKTDIILFTKVLCRKLVGWCHLWIDLAETFFSWSVRKCLSSDTLQIQWEGRQLCVHRINTHWLGRQCQGSFLFGKRFVF